MVVLDKLIDQQMLIIFYRKEVERDASLANVALLANARKKFKEMQE